MQFSYIINAFYLEWSLLSNAEKELTFKSSVSEMIRNIF